MAKWDTDDLISTIKTKARRPGVDAEMDDPGWIALLALADEKWYDEIAVYAPEVLYGPMTQLVSEDGGYTYQFSTASDSQLWPRQLELKDARNGVLLIPGPEWGDFNDYTIEQSTSHAGAQLRTPQNRTQSWSDGGPWGRWVPNYDSLAVVSTSQNPHIPSFCRRILPAATLVEWANKGASRDPRPFEREVQHIWEGHPSRS